MRYLLSLYWSYLKFVCLGTMLSAPFLVMYDLGGGMIGVLLFLAVGALMGICIIALEYFGDDPGAFTRLIRWSHVKKGAEKSKSAEAGKTP